ncbi:hypothetical protein DFH09DRAFT_1275242 [Mycena vulgaris]|nr:hypothetical protein DFH09DRAFT_1275242 [Mycena vulgaris]
MSSERRRKNGGDECKTRPSDIFRMKGVQVLNWGVEPVVEARNKRYTKWCRRTDAEKTSEEVERHGGRKREKPDPIMPLHRSHKTMHRLPQATSGAPIAGDLEGQARTHQRRVKGASGHEIYFKYANRGRWSIPRDSGNHRTAPHLERDSRCDDGWVRTCIVPVQVIYRVRRAIRREKRGLFAANEFNSKEGSVGHPDSCAMKSCRTYLRLELPPEHSRELGAKRRIAGSIKTHTIIDYELRENQVIERTYQIIETAEMLVVTIINRQSRIQGMLGRRRTPCEEGLKEMRDLPSDYDHLPRGFNTRSRLRLRAVVGITIWVERTVKVGYKGCLAADGLTVKKD